MRREALARLVDLNRQRSHTLAELARHTAWLDRQPVRFDEKAARKHLTPETGTLLEELGKRLAALEDWNEEGLARVFDALCAERDLKMGKVAQPVRVALTGDTISPGIYETLAVVGREESLARIAAATAQAQRPRD